MNEHFKAELNFSWNRVLFGKNSNNGQTKWIVQRNEKIIIFEKLMKKAKKKEMGWSWTMKEQNEKKPHTPISTYSLCLVLFFMGDLYFVGRTDSCFESSFQGNGKTFILIGWCGQGNCVWFFLCLNVCNNLGRDQSPITWL